jgi:hypothetical protein
VDRREKGMKSIVSVDIDAPQQQVAALFTDPGYSTEWMDDIERCEPLSGQPGTPGSRYRLVPKRGSLSFTATVISRELPDDVRLSLDGDHVTVDVHGMLSPLPDGGTKLVSEEDFEFKGALRKALGLLAKPAIHGTHRRHLEAFKRFAEGRLRGK